MSRILSIFLIKLTSDSIGLCNGTIGCRAGGQAVLPFSPPFFLPPPVINIPKIDLPGRLFLPPLLDAPVFDPSPDAIKSQPHAIAGS